MVGWFAVRAAVVRSRDEGKLVIRGTVGANREIEGSGSRAIGYTFGQPVIFKRK